MVTYLVAGSAGLYVASALAMKEWDNLGAPWALILIALTLSGGIWLEIEALRLDRLGYVFVLLIGLQCLLALLIAWLVLDESHSWQEMAGMTLIIVGVLLTRWKTADGLA